MFNTKKRFIFAAIFILIAQMFFACKAYAVINFIVGAVNALGARSGSAVNVNPDSKMLFEMDFPGKEKVSKEDMEEKLKAIWLKVKKQPYVELNRHVDPKGAYTTTFHYNPIPDVLSPKGYASYWRKMTTVYTDPEKKTSAGVDRYAISCAEKRMIWWASIFFGKENWNEIPQTIYPYYKGFVDYKGKKAEEHPLFQAVCREIVKKGALSKTP